MSFQLDDRIVPILERFRLHHVARLGSMKIDVDLITAAVERWRQETHSFNMTVGEMSITLQDVSCLLGLPINGYPVIGLSDDNWQDDVVACFGREDETWSAYRRVPGTYSLVTNWLKEPWRDPQRPKKARLPVDADDDEIERYEKKMCEI